MSKQISYSVLIHCCLPSSNIRSSSCNTQSFVNRLVIFLYAIFPFSKLYSLTKSQTPCPRKGRLQNKKILVYRVQCKIFPRHTYIPFPIPFSLSLYGLYQTLSSISISDHLFADGTFVWNIRTEVENWSLSSVEMVAIYRCTKSRIGISSWDSDSPIYIRYGHFRISERSSLLKFPPI